MRSHLDRVTEGGAALIKAELNQPVEFLLVVDVEGNLQSPETLENIFRSIASNV